MFSFLKYAMVLFPAQKKKKMKNFSHMLLVLALRFFGCAHELINYFTLCGRLLWLMW